MNPESTEGSHAFRGRTVQGGTAHWAYRWRLDRGGVYRAGGQHVGHNPLCAEQCFADCLRGPSHVAACEVEYSPSGVEDGL